MFISRKSIKLPSMKNKVSNQNQESESQLNLANTRSHQAEITQYPTFSYFVSIIFFASGIYLIYSSQGGPNSIPGYNSNAWWQYVVAAIPILIAIAMWIFSESQSVCISKNQNSIWFERKYLLSCLVRQRIQKELKDLIGLSIVKEGVERITLTSTSYFIVFNFKSCQEIHFLGCGSEITALAYFQHLKNALPNAQINSQLKIVIKDLVEM